MKQGNLNIRCTEDYAVLYWDKPAAAPSGAEYTVSLNGEAIGRTDRTHFTIEGLSYGSSFRVDVVSGSYCCGCTAIWKFIWPRARSCRAQRTFTTIRPASPAGLRAPRCAATQAF